MGIRKSTRWLLDFFIRTPGRASALDGQQPNLTP